MRFPRPIASTQNTADNINQSADPNPYLEFRNAYPINFAWAHPQLTFNGVTNPFIPVTTLRLGLNESLAQRPGIVKSRDALMDAAYDDQVYVDDRTIDSHIKRLRKKFKVVDDEFEMIETLYGVGYRFKEA